MTLSTPPRILSARKDMPPIHAKLHQLAVGTAFRFLDKTWEKTGACRASCIKCIPRLGDKFQPSMAEWFSENITVTFE